MGFNWFRSRKIQNKISEGESTGFDLFNYVLDTYLITSVMEYKKTKAFFQKRDWQTIFKNLNTKISIP